MKKLECEINRIENLKYIIEGYGICALEKMIPSDVPVVYIYDVISQESQDFLKKNMNKCCVIGVGEAGLYLIQNNIKVDFILFPSGTSCEKFNEIDGWQNIPLILNSDISNNVLEKHLGKKFWIISENEIEKKFIKKILSEQEHLYRYNELIENSTDPLENFLVSLANYMGDYYTLVFANETVFLYKEELLIEKSKLCNEKFNKYFKISVNMPEILSWLVPFIQPSKRGLAIEVYNSYLDEWEKVHEVIEKNIQLYEKLYGLAFEKNILKTEIDSIIECLNNNTQMLEQIGYMQYLIQLSEMVEISLEKKEKINEVAAISVEGIEQYKKLDYVIKKMTATFTPVKLENNLDEKERSILKKGRNILLVSANSQYNVLPNFVEGLKKGFQECGVITYVYNPADPYRYSKIKEKGYNYFQNTTGYQYILLMNGVMSETERYDNVIDDYKCIFDNKNSKIIPFFVDHPLFHMGRIKHLFSSYAMLFADENWVRFTKKYIKNEKSVVFLPLGGCNVEPNFKSNFEDRENKIVFFGGYFNIHEQEEKISKHRYAKVIFKIIEALKKDPSKTIENVVEMVELKYGSNYTIHYIVFETDVFGIIDTYIRQYYRQKVVEAIIYSGIPIDIYGWNENSVYDTYSNVHFKDKVSFEEMMEIYKKVRFVLNIQPWLKSGTQERVFNTMLSGAIAVTDITDFLLENTIDGVNIVHYNLSDLERLPDKILYYMQHDKEAKKIAQNGYKLAKEKHTWSSRAKEIVDKIM